MNADKKPSFYKGFAAFGSLGIELVISVLIGAGAGYLLDNWLSTKPWLMVVGFIFGAAAGFRDAYRLIVKADWEDKHDK